MAINAEKRETALRLAKGHAAIEPYLKSVHLLEPLNGDDPEDAIWLLEVLDGTIELGISPIGFPPDATHGIAYPSVIVEVSPREFVDLIKPEGSIHFRGRDWKVGELLAGETVAYA